MPKNFALRRPRKGTGVLPPNPNRWEQEHNALDLRHELALPLDDPLALPLGLADALPTALAELEDELDAEDVADDELEELALDVALPVDDACALAELLPRAGQSRRPPGWALVAWPGRALMLAAEWAAPYLASEPNMNQVS